MKRLVIGALSLFALATITFFLIHAIPDSPFSGDAGRLPANAQEQLIEHYALDEPLRAQYVKYLGNVLHGDFGVSLSHNGRNVADILLLGVSNSARLGTVAFIIALVLGIFLGTVAAFSKRRWINGIVGTISAVGISVPSFLLGLLMMLLFGVILHWLPIVGLSTWRHYIIPALALALPPIAMISHLTKTSLLEAMRQDYMLLARSKGTGQLKMILRHALKNALVPVVNYISPLIASLMTGTLVIETLFSVQGIGAEFVVSVLNRDYTMIMALTIFYGTIIIACNVITDLISAVLDPRLRLK